MTYSTGQLCIEPKPKEPSKHQYDYDAMTVIGFLKIYSLDKHFKVRIFDLNAKQSTFQLNIEPNHTMLAGHDYLHDVAIASACRMLGTISLHLRQSE